ncbi:disease resistance protein [Tanacetum coccineum]
MLVFDSDYKSNIRQISNHVYLRVLYLKGIQSSTLPKSICKLIHLRYLKISNSDIKVLPESIIYIQNLQTLILEWCLWLRELPKGLRYMRNLQHLDLYGCFGLQHMPVGIKELTNLRRLSQFAVGKDDGARIGELGNLNLLGSELTLSRLENVGGLRDAKSANLKDKTNLKSLGLEWSELTLPETFDSEVLEGLEPNSGLQKLTIQSYMGTVLSLSWLVKLVNLTSIGFFGVDKCEQLPPLGKLPSLKRIKLIRMQSLKCFHDDDDATSKDEILFPNLQELVIYECPALVSLPSNFPKLTSLSIELCDELRSLPDEIQSFNDLNEITILSCEILRRRCEKDVGEDWPKISHIPHIDIGTSRNDIMCVIDEVSDEEVELGSVYETFWWWNYCPALDENFVMGIKLARKVLKRQVPSQEFAEKKHLEGFWLEASYVHWEIQEMPKIPSTSSFVQGEKRRREDQHEINCDCEDEDVEVELLDDNVDKKEDQKEENDAEVETDQEENGSQAEADKEKNEVEAVTHKEDNDLKKLIKKYREKDAEIARLKSLVKEKETESAKVPRFRDQKDTNISFLDSRASYLKSALDDSQAACTEAKNLISTLSSERDGLASEVSTLQSAFRDFKEKMEAQQEAQAQVLYNRVADLEAHVMDVSGRLEGEFYPAYLTALAGRRWLLTHGVELAMVKCLKSPEYQNILGHALGRAVDFGMQEGLAAGHEHGVAGTPLSAVVAYNPEIAEANYLDAVRALEEADFPLVHLLKSKKDSGMDEVLDCFLLDGPLADLPEAAHLQPCLEQLSIPIYHADVNAVVGETSLSFSLLNVHTRVEGAKKHVAALHQLMVDIVSHLCPTLKLSGVRQFLLR